MDSDDQTSYRCMGMPPGSYAADACWAVPCDWRGPLTLADGETPICPSCGCLAYEDDDDLPPANACTACGNTIPEGRTRCTALECGGEPLPEA